VAAQVHASNKVLSVQAFARRTAVLTCRFYLKFAFPYSWCFSTPFNKCSTGQEPSVPTGNSIHLWCIRVTTDQPTNNQPTTWATLCVMHAKSKFTDDRSTLRCGFNAGPTIALSWTAACIPAANTSSLADTCTSHQIISALQPVVKVRGGQGTQPPALISSPLMDFEPILLNVGPRLLFSVWREIDACLEYHLSSLSQLILFATVSKLYNENMGLSHPKIVLFFKKAEKSFATRTLPQTPLEELMMLPRCTSTSHIFAPNSTVSCCQYQHVHQSCRRYFLPK